MDDINEYWKMMEYPPVFTNIDWNEEGGQSTFIPMDFDNQKVPPSYQHQPFQRRRSSSVDLPINPLYANTNRMVMNMSNEPTIQEEDYMTSPPPNLQINDFPTRMNRIGSSATLEFPGNYSNYQLNAESPLSTASSFTDHPNTNTMHAVSQPPPKESLQQTITFFPELHRTSYNTLLGKQLKQHQKRRRSSSLPPVFHNKPKHQHVPTPLIFTQIQVTDPTPIHHTQKAQKVDTRPVQIERVHKPQPKPVVCDPIETQKKLDNQLAQLNFEDVTVAELKEMLRERGLTATGKKAVLTDRLRDARDLLVKTQPWLAVNSANTGGRSQSNSASPNIQGLANMTIHSPIPPTQCLFMPLDDELNVKMEPNSPTATTANDHVYQYPTSLAPNSVKYEDSISPVQQTTDMYPAMANHSTHDSLQSYQYHTDQELDINDIFNFDTATMADDAVLFPSQWNQPGVETEWDQDKLDFFLKQLV